MPGPRLPLVGTDPARPRAVGLVGRYALGVSWEDGHESLYPFPVLRRLCSFAADGEEAPLAWPAAIHRASDALRVRWLDGREGAVAYRDLRDRCPCAGCAARQDGGRA